MTQENSHIQDAGGANQTHGCIPVLVPPQIWAKLLKPPFRKRHPIIFWSLMTPALLFLALLVIGFFMENDDSMPEEDSLALIQVRGAILDPSATLAWIRRLEQAENIKGALVRIDSPGGGAAASQEIYAALERLGQKIPIVASMGSMAASGGLMVAMAARRVFANPSTVTGSIGVRMDIPQLQDLMHKIGVGQETLVSAPFKDAASYTHPLSPQAREYLDGVLMDMHGQFVEIVAKGRHMELEQAKKLATGKIFTGQQALALGLVDEMGGQYEAHGWLCEQTGIERKRKLIARKSVEPGSLKWFLSTVGASLEKFVETWAGAGESARPAFLYQF